ncbi:MAG: signal peptide peptidase SppA [Saprospiraceae bacterium]
MSQFLKFVFASCLGTALALVLLCVIAFGWVAGIASSATEKKTVEIQPNSVLKLDFQQVIPQRTNNLPIDPFDVENDQVLGLTDIVAAIERAKDDIDIKGIYLNASVIPTGKASASTIRKALVDFKSSGKFIIAYASFYTQGAYYLASVADSILMNPQGAVDFRGYSSMVPYYKGLLDKLDVKMRIFYCGKFKSYTESFRLKKMSEENRLQTREYLTALNDILIRDISASRSIPEDELRQIADRFDGFSGEKSVSSGLVDRLAYEDEVLDLMRNKLGLEEKEKFRTIELEDYFRGKGKNIDFSIKDKIAVVYAEGTIYDGKDGDPGETYDGKYVKLLRKIRKDDKVKAVVLRVNSPGGSSLASDNILRELDLCKKAGKPVVVSMADVAASGGYLISCHADSIFAEEGTITGSIGVFGMIPILDATMENKLGITYDTVKTGKYSAFGTPFVDFSPQESALIQGRVDEIYGDFLQKVATGRKQTKEQIDEIAQGRVYSGSRAKEIGLVDDIGGLDRALQAAASLAGIKKYRSAEYPEAKTGMEQLLEKLLHKDKFGDDVKASMIRQELKEFYPAYKTMQEFRKSKGILARMPFEWIVN